MRVLLRAIVTKFTTDTMIEKPTSIKRHIFTPKNKILHGKNIQMICRTEYCIDLED